MNRRDFVTGTTAALGAIALRAQEPSKAGVAHRLTVTTTPIADKKLTGTRFQPLPLGEVRPAGWLQRQLRIQANGMSGHLDEFWPDVGLNSAWLGGPGEAWERGPYFLDGLVPLAYLLDDEALKAKAMKFIERTLTHQQPNGMIGPQSNDDWWPRMVMLKALAQYYEVTSDPRVLPLMTRYCHYQLQALPDRPLKSWGKYRWQDNAWAVQWLYDRTGDPLLLQLTTLLQSQGYDWKAQFADFKYTTPTPRGLRKSGLIDQAMQAHGVNNSQALKVAAVQYRMTGDHGEQAAFARQSGALDKYHGMPNGMFSCDEHLGGLEPQHGTELCSVVETMFSLEVVLATFGDAAVADRLEKIAYNALPGTFTDDMWAHQYNQQSNQIQVGLLSKPWTTDGPESNLYGLAPNFGCCTANYHQGWPKFTSSLWMKGPEDELIAALFAPCELRTNVRGTEVHISEETEYPFRNTLRLVVNPSRPLAFPLSVRVPGWTNGATLRINGKAENIEMPPGTFARIERTWAAGDVVEVVFPMQTRVSRWFNRSIALERGPLVFSLDPGENWVKLRDRGMTADWQVYPKESWNYALAVDESSAAKLVPTESKIGARPFAASDTGVRLQIPVQRLDAWRSEDGVAQGPPESPAKDALPLETMTFVPYACAKLRVTAFPSSLS